MIDPDRGTGRTTRQMEAAPKGALFVFAGGANARDYNRSLARKLGRDDLRILSPTEFEQHSIHRLRGIELTGIEIDHAVDLTQEQVDGYRTLLPMIRRRA